MFVLMTLGFAACNLPILWKLPSAWRDRRDPALDGERDTDLWIWLFAAALSVGIGLRFFGHYYMQLVPPLALLAAGALVAQRAPCRHRHDRRGVVVGGRRSRPPGYFMQPFGPEPTYESVSRYLAANTDPDDKILVWGSVPEIYWASDRLPATRFLTTPTFLTGNHPGRPPTRSTPTPTADPRTGSTSTRTSPPHPPRYISTRRRRSSAAPSTPISSYPKLTQRSSRSSTATCARSKASPSTSASSPYTRGQGVER